MHVHPVQLMFRYPWISENTKIITSTSKRRNDGILCVWRGRIGIYHLNSEKLGFNTAQGPQARGLY